MNTTTFKKCRLRWITEEGETTREFFPIGNRAFFTYAQLLEITAEELNFFIIGPEDSEEDDRQVSPDVVADLDALNDEGEWPCVKSLKPVRRTSPNTDDSD